MAETDKGTETLGELEVCEQDGKEPVIDKMPRDNGDTVEGDTVVEKVIEEEVDKEDVEEVKSE